METGEPNSRVARAMLAVERRPTYVRSFAYGTGPGLGLLLDRWMLAWPDSLRATPAEARSPARLLARAVGFMPPRDARTLAREADRRSLSYGGAELALEETHRDSVRRARLAEYRARLMDGPVLVLRQNGLMRSFNPNELVPFDSASTVYPTGTFEADWGKLELASGGALVANDFRTLRLPAPAAVEGRVISGSGWTLTLAAGWVARKSASRVVDYEVIREVPSPK
jgi:hypothetical protein